MCSCVCVFAQLTHFINTRSSCEYWPYSIHPTIVNFKPSQFPLQVTTSQFLSFFLRQNVIKKSSLYRFLVFICGVGASYSTPTGGPCNKQQYIQKLRSLEAVRAPIIWELFDWLILLILLEVWLQASSPSVGLKFPNHPKFSPKSEEFFFPEIPFFRFRKIPKNVPKTLLFFWVGWS